MRWRFCWLFVLAVGSVAVAQRVCQSPDALFVDSSAPARSLHLFIYVPPTTPSFVLAVFDQGDDGEVGQPSTFVLYAPDGKEAMRLTQPQRKAWSEYPITVNGRWGIWRLTVTGPQPPAGTRQIARNFFLVRTVGEVDLFAKPEPAVIARGLRFSEPRFGGMATHHFTLQVPQLSRLRLNFLRSREGGSEVQLQPPEGVQAQQRWGGLPRGSIEFLEVTGANLQGLWRLTVNTIKGIYALGVEQELRLFFTDAPLMPFPRPVVIGTFVADDNALVPARLEATSPQTANEPYVTYTDRQGIGALFLLPGVAYRVTASRGFEFEPQTVSVAGEVTGFSIPIRRRFLRPAGWYCGDDHVHTIYSDGTDTPAQMAEAARGEGLDWVTLTDHGVGPVIQQVLTAHQEALPYSDPGKFVVIPGEEFTTPYYHANVINGTVLELPTAPLQKVIDTVLEMDSLSRPVTVKLNHPTWSGTPKAADLARQLERLPLVELWNSPEPAATHLWWELLNKGLRVFAETSTDTHDRKTAPLGHRRTYIYLGDKPLTAENIVRALRSGHSFLSRGALLFLEANGVLPGGEVPLARQTVTVHLRAVSALPIDRIELVHNGKVIRSLPVGGRKEFADEITLAVGEGWLLAQAMERENAVPLAMTNPVFLRSISAVTTGVAPPSAAERHP